MTIPELQEKTEKTSPTPLQYADFSKLELRVGLVLSAEKIEGSEKLVKLSVETGNETRRTLVAGIGKAYHVESLVGKKIIVLCNLEPKKLKGIESQGMLLAAGETSDHLALLTVEHDVSAGTRIY